MSVPSVADQAPPASSARARPLYVRSGSGHVFGLVHEPAGTPSGLGVLICPQFGWDEVSSYRARREWAGRLAGDGHLALRIDLPGAGNSTGSPRDGDRVGAWTAAVADAARFLRFGSGCQRIAAIGLGLGGLIVCLAAATGAPIEELILWAVPSRGRTLVREQKAFALLEAEETAGDGPAPPEGEIVAGGFVLTAETVAALGAVDLAGVALSPARALLLGRDGIPPDAALRAQLEASGAEVTVEAGEGWGAMVAHPEQAIVPEATIARVSVWLAGADSPAGAPSGEPAAADALALGSGAEELPLTLEQDWGQGFGLLVNPPAAAHDPVVLLNAGALRHIGPNRIWTEAARRWAAAGIPSFRVDIEGVGDADGPSSRHDDVSAFYVPELAAQVTGTLDFLERRGLPPRFTLAGLCSGAFWAFHAALQDPRVRTVVLLNPRLFYWDATLGAARDWRRLLGALLNPRRWGELRGVENPASRGLAVLKLALRAPLHLPARLRGRRAARQAGGDALDQALDRLRDQGTRVVMAFSGDEPLYEELEREGRLDRLDRWPNVEIHRLPGHSHTLKPVWVQREAHALLDRVVGPA